MLLLVRNYIHVCLVYQQMNMLLRLQEAASYSSPQSQDSDTNSLDSHGSIDKIVVRPSSELSNKDARPDEFS